MRSVTGLGIVAVLVLSCVVARGQDAQPAKEEPMQAAPVASGPAPTKIGFVRYEDVFRKCEKSTVLNGEFERMKESYRSEMDKYRKDLETLGKQIDQMREGSPERRAKETEFAQMRATADHYAKTEQEKLMDFLVTNHEKLYVEICRLVQKYGKENGYLAIFFSWPVDAESIDSRSVEELNFKINSRGLVYFAEQEDLTEKILEALNKLGK